MTIHNVYIGLGGNLENPREQVERAFVELASLPQSELLAQSPLYQSRPVGPAGQPDYINAVALIKTQLPPIELLDALQAIEQAHRRVRLEHWGPRTLDLDILLIDNQVLNTERLTVPHPFMTQRSFVLYPLADIAPDLILPCGTALASLIARCDRDGLVRLETHRES
jgi:2-amino-4-hydroxy-6-hydroxymethyldihydropteridine diphosphokinase